MGMRGNLTISIVPRRWPDHDQRRYRHFDSVVYTSVLRVSTAHVYNTVNTLQPDTMH
jgi:hypothetical protein